MKAFRWTAGIILSIILITEAVVYTISRPLFIRKIIIPAAEKALGAKIMVGEILIHPFLLNISLNHIVINSPGNYDISIDGFFLEWNPADLLLKKLTVTNLSVETVKMTFYINPGEPGHDAPGNERQAAHQKKPSPLYFDIRNIYLGGIKVACIIRKTPESAPYTIGFSNLFLCIPDLKTNTKNTATLTGCLFAHNSDKSYFIEEKFKQIIGIEINEKLFPVFLKLTSTFSNHKTVTTSDLLLESDNGKNYKLGGNIRKMPLSPIINAFSDETMTKTDALLDSLDITAYGPDLMAPDAADKVSGSLKAKLEKISIPVQFRNMPVGDILFLPISLISNLNKYLPGNIVPGKISDLMNQAGSVVKGANTLEFDRGDIDISVENKNVHINKFAFSGSDSCVINELTVTGSIYGYNGLDLDTKTNMAGISIPMRIKGTVSAPQPDMDILLPELLGSNFRNVLGLVKKNADSLGDNLGDTAKQILKSIPDKSSNNQEGNTAGKEVKNLINDVGNLFK